MSGPAGMPRVDLLVRADWVCPIDRAPLAQGWVAIDRDRIVAVGQGDDAPAAHEVRTFGRAAVLPALVNAHTHLELSWLRGRVPPAGDFLTWVAGLMAERRELERFGDPATTPAIHEAIDELTAAGTIAVGDISNALVTPLPLASAGLAAVVFHELIGFKVTSGDAHVAREQARHDGMAAGDVRLRVAPHAPFSVSRELFCAIAAVAAREAAPATSVHLAESPDEVLFLADGSGGWPARLRALGAWRDDWQPPRQCPTDYLYDLGVLRPGALAVHGVQLTDAELERLAAVDVTLVTCPRSNRWVGVGDPPLARFLASGIRLALGTDSLASCPDLNLFAELAALRRLAPDAPARRLLQTATADGATALGLGADLGTIAVGKRAALLAVALDGGTRDPEEALLAGVASSRVQWAAHGGYHGGRH